MNNDVVLWAKAHRSEESSSLHPAITLPLPPPIKGGEIWSPLSPMGRGYACIHTKKTDSS
jgi:hypothetical protein